MIYRIEHHEGFGHVSHIRVGDYDLSSVVDVYFDHIRRARGIDEVGDVASWVDEFGDHYLMDSDVVDDVGFISVRYSDEDFTFGESCEEWVIRPVRSDEIADIWSRRDLNRVRPISYYETSHQSGVIS